MLRRILRSFGVQGSEPNLARKIVASRENLTVEREGFNHEDFVIEVVRRRRTNIVLSVLPPDGKLRLLVPRNLAQQKIADVVAKRRDWIERNRARMLAASARYEKVFGVTPGSPLALAHGAKVRLHSKNLKLQIVRDARFKRPSVTRDVSDGTAAKAIAQNGSQPSSSFAAPTLLMQVPIKYNAQRCEQLLWSWYRCELERSVANLIVVWEQRLGVSVSSWRVRRMYTRWGSCNTRGRNINLNIELARRPRRCLEFVVVHELVHLLERGHTARFYALMDQFLPRWRVAKAVLDAVPLVRLK